MTEEEKVWSTFWLFAALAVIVISSSIVISKDNFYKHGCKEIPRPNTMRNIVDCSGEPNVQLSPTASQH